VSSTTLVRWTIATLVFLAVTWLATTRSHGQALLLLLALLIGIAIFGGHGRPRSGPPEADGHGNDPSAPNHDADAS
jgi:hypothetical protein